ncbi:MAG: phosphatidylglycerol:prolipoprotein diacylglycerol transferase [Microgenomates group bacterium LiPW_16]|nr:MAG: phosphatidylglycerol:prolipoprotein diacylglycerol transferase [Microgenomates group bacterium LiPW_16]
MYPILFSIGPVKIYSFGVFLVLAAIAGSFEVWREGRSLKFDEEKLLDLILIEAIAGLAGARIYYLILHFEDFGFNPFSWFLIFHFPGLSFLGAIIGGLIGAFIFAKKTGWSFCQIGDFLVLGVSLGEAIGRIGAFLSGSAYGALTSLPWGVPMIGLIGRRHPSQIYEGLAAFLTFAALLRLKTILEIKKLPSGLIFLLYFLFFGASRFFLEFFRGDSVYFRGWRTTQIGCLVFIITAVILLYKRLGRSVKTDVLAIIRKVRHV